VDSLGDPYTVYMNAKEYKAFNTQMAGSYAGIGIYVGEKAGKIIVIAPIEGSPAEKVGIKSGDTIVAVNGTNVTSKDMDKAVSMMLGKPGTNVKITFNRAGLGNFVKQITRAQIVIKSVKAEMLTDKVGYIKIAMFDENTSDEFIKALDGLESQGEKGLIIDLRDNGGGLLDESGRIADKLLGKGTIVYTIDNKNQKEVWTSDESKFNKPLVLLVNGGTASASEILSGAVRDFKAGTLIGTKTFGKGIVQIPKELSDGSAVKVTIARYYTPSGECIQKKGITPNIILDLNKKAKDEYNKTGIVKQSDDNQLQKGIEVIESK
jgi:carboxyl-terminal processing protease